MRPSSAAHRHACDAARPAPRSAATSAGRPGRRAPSRGPAAARSSPRRRRRGRSAPARRPAAPRRWPAGCGPSPARTSARHASDHDQRAANDEGADGLAHRHAAACRRSAPRRAWTRPSAPAGDTTTTGRSSCTPHAQAQRPDPRRGLRRRCAERLRRREHDHHRAGEARPARRRSRRRPAATKSHARPVAPACAERSSARQETSGRNRKRLVKLAARCLARSIAAARTFEGTAHEPDPPTDGQCTDRHAERLLAPRRR